jgi:hypothetical protein
MRTVCPVVPEQYSITVQYSTVAHAYSRPCVTSTVIQYIVQYSSTLTVCPVVPVVLSCMWLTCDGAPPAMNAVLTNSDLTINGTGCMFVRICVIDWSRAMQLFFASCVLDCF